MSKKPESIEFNSSEGNLRLHRADHESNYTDIPNESIRDEKLSWKARGLHHYILSLPDTWEINISHLVRQSDKDERDSVKAALKELESLGYISKAQIESIPVSPSNSIRSRSAKEWQEIRSQVFDRDNYTCTYCGAKSQKLHCDHVTPISKGGGDEMSNLTTSCQFCNLSKGNKTAQGFNLIGQWGN